MASSATSTAPAPQQGSGLPGFWYSAGTSHAMPAMMTLTSVGIAIVHLQQTGTTVAKAPLAWLTLSERTNRTARRIAFPDGGMFETFHNDAIDEALARLAHRKSGSRHGLQHLGPRVAAIALILLVAGAALYRFGTPLIVETAVSLAAPNVAVSLSEKAFAELDAMVLKPSQLSEERKTPIREGFRALAAMTTPGARGMRLEFRGGGTMGASALSLPNGTVIVTDELVALSENDTMVLAVLAHEIGEILNQQSLRRLYGATGTSGLMTLIAGDWAGGTETVTVDTGALASRAIAQDGGADAEADMTSVELMRGLGRKPDALADFLQILSAQEGQENGSPAARDAMAARIEAIRATAGSAQTSN